MNDQGYVYDLVQFTSSKKKIKDIECLPSFWVTFDKNTQKCLTKYPPPPYKTKTLKLLHQMIKNKNNPIDDWPTFQVTIKGQARSYEEGIKKLSILETEQYVFSNTEVPAAHQSSQIEHKKRQDQLQEDSESMLWQMQLSITSANIIDVDAVSSTDNEYEKSSDDETNKNEPGQRKRKLPSKNCKTTKETKITQSINNVPSDISVEHSIFKNDKETQNQNNIVDITDQFMTHEDFFSYKKSTEDKLSEILNNQKCIIDLLQSSEYARKGVEGSVLGFTEKYKIDFPFKTKTDLDNFDKNLGTNSELRADFIRILYFWYIPKSNTLTRQLTNIFQRILVKTVAIQYTSSKKMGEKTVIKDYNILKCLYESLESKNMGSRSEILKAVGVVLTNSKDWDGGRKVRDGDKSSSTDDVKLLNAE